MAKVKDNKLADEALPSPQEARAAFEPALGQTLERARSRLLTVRNAPPQLVHFEGGNGVQRRALGLWWAAALNCQNPAPDGAPCLACSNCLRLGADLSVDLICLDGSRESIKIGEIRELKPMLGERPHYLSKRLVLLLEAQALTLEAANALLKSLEEPNPGTVFAFTVPQREKLLPTLVSRGWVLTLPWPSASAAESDSLGVWHAALAQFANTGQGWFELTAQKGGVSQTLALELLEMTRKAMSAALSGQPGGALADLLQGAEPDFFYQLSEVCDTCQERLLNQTAPALILDCLATRLNLLLRARANA